MGDPSPRPHIPGHQIGIPAAVSVLAAEIDWCFCFRRGGESDVSGDQEQDEARMEDMGESEDMQEQEPDLQSLGLAATTPATFIQKTAWEQTILALQQLGVRDLVTSPHQRYYLHTIHSLQTSSKPYDPQPEISITLTHADTRKQR